MGMEEGVGGGEIIKERRTKSRGDNRRGHQGKEWKRTCSSFHLFQGKGQVSACMMCVSVHLSLLLLYPSVHQEEVPLYDPSPAQAFFLLKAVFPATLACSGVMWTWSTCITTVLVCYLHVLHAYTWNKKGEAQKGKRTIYSRLCRWAGRTRFIHYGKFHIQTRINMFHCLREEDKWRIFDVKCVIEDPQHFIKWLII